MNSQNAWAVRAHPSTPAAARGAIRVSTQALASRGPNARNCGHSSPADAASMCPSGLNRRTSAVRSSARSHRIIGAQPTVPRRHHCRPPARIEGFSHARRGQSGRPRSPGVAGQRLWLMEEALGHSRRAMQTARAGALRRASALRPLAAAFFAESCVAQPGWLGAVPSAWNRLLPAQHHQHRRTKTP
jgi:hypothetical protein